MTAGVTPPALAKNGSEEEQHALLDTLCRYTWAYTRDAMLNDDRPLQSERPVRWRLYLRVRCHQDQLGLGGPALSF